MSRREFRVFVVEDHPATARGLKMFLELSGYQVDIASDLDSALKIAGKARFDVLVCDLNLPDGTGWQLMEALQEKNRKVRGIAFSAFDDPEHVERSREAGFEEHVVKGTTPEALLAAIDRLAQFETPPDPILDALVARKPAKKRPATAKKPAGTKRKTASATRNRKRAS